MQSGKQYEAGYSRRKLISKLLFFFSLLLIGYASWAQSSAVYPEQKGAVNDYAGRLTDSQISDLTGLIQDYERRTSIQFVVAIVDDLHGLPARQYAINLGNRWGVGQSGRNNGVVLLWAPRERAYSLRFADGLKADVSDSDAAAITQEHLLPHFKQEQYYDGLKNTVLATMQRLGSQTWEERIQSRARRTQEERQGNEAFQQWLLAGFLLVGLSVLAIVFARKWRQRREKLTEMAQAKDVIANALSKAEENVPRIQQLLDNFAKEAPEQKLSALRTSLTEQPARVLQIKVDATTLNFEDVKSYDEIVDARTRAETESDLLENVQQQVAEIKSARERSQTLLRKMSRETFAISKLRDASRRDEIADLLTQSRQDYEQARRYSSMSMVDWLIIDQLLNRSREQNQKAVEISQTEPPGPSFGDYGGPNFVDNASSLGFDGPTSGGSGFDGGSGADGHY